MRLPMRIPAFLLLLALLATPVLPAPSLVGTVMADDDGKPARGNNGDDDDDGNNGHGNDDDGVDESNPGKSKVTRTAGFTVEVTCETDADATTCSFLTTNPDDDDVEYLLVPDDVACATVTDGGEHVDNVGNSGRGGYRLDAAANDDDDSSVSPRLVFDGAVSTSGVATYWVMSDEGLFPATGVGLTCDQAASVPDGTPVTPVDAQSTSGTISIVTARCPGVSAGDDIDWYGTCTAGTSGTEFALENGSSQRTTSTIDDGTATFSDLTPGTYTLSDTTGNWCHAESDNVDAEGNVIVEEAATTNVWFFYCDA